MDQIITGFHRDEAGDWVAELACGHRQHVRHRPPFQQRPWVTTARGRADRVGTPLACPLCDRDVSPPPATAHITPQLGDEGGDPACWAGLMSDGSEDA